MKECEFKGIFPNIITKGEEAMSKWSIFLNETKYCQSMRGTGNRPCDNGVPCDRCHYDRDLQERFKKAEPHIKVEEYCSYCNHKLEEGETHICYECSLFDE